MSRLQTIQAYLENAYHLVMQEGLESGANVEGMQFVLAIRTSLTAKEAIGLVFILFRLDVVYQMLVQRG